MTDNFLPNLNTLGLIIDIIGFALIYLYGIHPELQNAKIGEPIDDLQMTSGKDKKEIDAAKLKAEEVKLKAQQFRTLSKFGFCCVILGFILQILADIY